MTGKSIDRGNSTCKGPGAGSARWAQEPEHRSRREHEEGARGEGSRDLAAPQALSVPGSAFMEPWSSRARLLRLGGPSSLKRRLRRPSSCLDVHPVAREAGEAALTSGAGLLRRNTL